MALIERQGRIMKDGEHLRKKRSEKVVKICKSAGEQETSANGEIRDYRTRMVVSHRWSNGEKERQGWRTSASKIKSEKEAT